MAQADELVLRGLHVPAAPSWWPPAPGWWIVAAVLLLLALAGLAWSWRRRRRRQAWQALFDRSVAQAQASAQVAAMSELLRRAARRVDARADTLQGEAWLRFLDGEASKGRQRKDFSEGDGRLLLDGGFRRQLDPDQVAGVAALARARFLALMAGRR